MANTKKKAVTRAVPNRVTPKKIALDLPQALVPRFEIAELQMEGRGDYGFGVRHS